MADNDQISDLLHGMKAALEAAYQRGFEAGGEAMRQTILAATASPVSLRVFGGGGNVPPAVIAEQRARLRENTAFAGGELPVVRQPSQRAPRGLVSDVIRTVLRESPGLSISEIEERALRLAPDVSSKSVGNELRRREGDAYVREGKYKWYLKDQEPQKETGHQSDLDALLGNL